MSDWWSSLEANERRLIFIAGGLLGLILLAQLIVTPVRQASVEAQQDYETSVRTLSIVRSEIGQIQSAGMETRDGPVLSADTLRSAATGLALERGLGVSRIQARGDGKIVVSLEAADPRLVFAWLQDVQTQLGAGINRISAAQGEGGTIQVIVDLQGGV